MAFRATSAIMLAAAQALSVAGCRGSGAGSVAGGGRPSATDPVAEPAANAGTATSPYPATALAAAARLRLPVLFAVAKGDPYVSVQQTRQLYQEAGSRHKQLVILGPEQGHGWDLVTAQPDDLRPVFSRTLVAFLRTVTS